VLATERSVDLQVRKKSESSLPNSLGTEVAALASVDVLSSAGTSGAGKAQAGHRFEAVQHFVQLVTLVFRAERHCKRPG
jgi:hypothetical protein